MKPPELPGNVTWLSDSDYAKAVGQFRLQINGVFDPFRQYGQDVFVPAAVEEIVELAEDFGLRVRGIDKEITLSRIRKKNGRFPEQLPEHMKEE
jgi:hypothetical protein